MNRIIAILFGAGLLLVGCREKPPRADAPSPRIVSFSPAITDLLYDMHLGDHVVGVTSYCMPPPGKPAPSVVGSRSRVSAEAILAVGPDVVLTQQNVNDFGAVKSIAPNVRIEHVRVETLADIAAAVERIGKIVGKEDLAEGHKKTFLDKLQAVRRRVSRLPRPKVLFVMGYERPATGGKGTFMDEMIRLAGGTNAAAERGYAGWKNLNRENILAMAPEVLVCQVSPGQAAGALKHFRSFRDLPAVKSGRIFPVSERRWTIPSMRSADFAARLADMIHPQAISREGFNG